MLKWLTHRALQAWRRAQGKPFVTRAAAAKLPTEYGEALAIDQWRSEHAEPLLAGRAEQRQLELAQALRALGGIADFVDNPANLARIGRAADRVRELVGDLQRDLDRRAGAREAGRER